MYVYRVKTRDGHVYEGQFQGNGGTAVSLSRAVLSIEIAEGKHEDMKIPIYEPEPGYCKFYPVELQDLDYEHCFVHLPLAGMSVSEKRKD